MRYLPFLLLTACAPHYMSAGVSEDPPVPTVEIEDAEPAYDRDEWGRWWDADHDCQDTRQEVLIAESLVPVEYDERGCKVLSGRWGCPFTGIVYTNPRQLDVDHLVPLKAAHDAGGYAWSKEAKRAYFNDLDNPGHLTAVSLSANRSKGDRGPLEWMPPNRDYHCEYLSNWMTVKANYKLAVTCEEGASIAMMMAKACRAAKEVPAAP